jgi:hypothetical protein
MKKQVALQAFVKKVFVTIQPLNYIFFINKKNVIIKLLVKGYTKKPTSEWIKREKDHIKQDLKLFNKKRERKEKKGCPL